MDNPLFSQIEGGVTAAIGFTAAAVKSGIKESGNLDLGLIISEVPASAVGAFTTNRIRAACVSENEKILPSEGIRAILCNAGNANACTGIRGVKDVERSRDAVGERLGVAGDRVLVASTGVIGKFLPVEKIENSLDELFSKQSRSGAEDFSRAIMTTDTVPKEFALRVKFSGGEATVGGTSKGAGMIQPNMATMLGFVTSDVSIDLQLLNSIHKSTVQQTFNNLTVDGDTSTNDMVLTLCNGASGVRVESEEDVDLFKKALYEVYNTLCAKIAEDGEGATKRIEITAVNGKTFEECRLAAKAVANSNLVKTAMYGNDPNWGRILCACGYSGAEFLPERIAVKLCGVPVYDNGGPASFEAPLLSEKLKEKVVHISIDLGWESGEKAVAHTCDFSYDYVKINAEYHT